MKVKELVEILSEYGPDEEIMLVLTDNNAVELGTESDDFGWCTLMELYLNVGIDRARYERKAAVGEAFRKAIESGELLA